MLNLITPLYRQGNLKKIRDSIPNYSDINWIIVLCQQRQDLVDECNELNLPYLSINEPDTKASINLKVNKGIENMKEGFFQGIDDDTEFNEESYNAYKKYGHYKMILGKQRMFFDGKWVIRCEQQEPECGKVDGAQALIHSSILKNVKVPSLEDSPCADGLFLKECWAQTDEKILIPDIISNYNSLRWNG